MIQLNHQLNKKEELKRRGVGRRLALKKGMISLTLTYIDGLYK